MHLQMRLSPMMCRRWSPARSITTCQTCVSLPIHYCNCRMRNSFAPSRYAQQTVLGFLDYMGGSLCNTKMTCMEHKKCICWVRPRGSAAVDANPTLLFRKLVRWLSQGIGATKEDHQEAGRLLKSSYCMKFEAFCEQMICGRDCKMYIGWVRDLLHWPTGWLCI